MLAGLQNVTFEFGARAILEDATWHIQPNEHIGLIGYNGTGKSTLLKLLVGEFQPSAGTVERSRTTTIGYLHQDLLSFDTSDSILVVAMSAFEKIFQLEKEIENLGKEIEKEHLANPNSPSSGGGRGEALLHQYTDKLHEMEVLDGYNIEHKTKEVLQGLGFVPADLERPFHEFSGGWRMRVLLAKMILQKPDLLLLDEPTNHLDLPSIEWLERYLQNYDGSVVIVSHDKFFLDRMVNKIVELYQQTLHFYLGNYSFYEKEKQQRIELQQRAYENQQDYIRQQERFIERFKAKASKAAQAQSVMKKLDKLDRIENAELERPSLRINFRIDKTPGKILVTLKHVSKSFGDINIVKNSSAEIDRGDKIALIGANGKGKSTLLRMVAGTESFSGERIWGHNVDESFYAQHQLEALNANNTVLEEMQLCGSQKNDLELRTLLGCFLFSGEDVDKRIRILSGGEKARLALAKTIVSKANFLLLDEPTNHLDMHSCELLIEALNKYEGSYILVSHDRYFISKTANKIWEIDNLEIKEFKGSYTEWVEWKERKAAAEKNAGDGSFKKNEKKDKQKKQTNNAVPEITNGQNENASAAANISVNTPINKEAKKELQKQQRLFQQTEERVNELKKKVAELESKLSAPETYSDKNKFIQAEADYQRASNELARANEQYEQLFEKIMELEKGI
ncbi:MAG: ABC-F family ATP-binding cassette domain-containing protein [Bacteroidetes bacterium]|nr:ABC-F family ATP-binding cassette domain-containing protein [Bacteroidota bacterium]